MVLMLFFFRKMSYIHKPSPAGNRGREGQYAAHHLIQGGELRVLYPLPSHTHSNDLNQCGGPVLGGEWSRCSLLISVAGGKQINTRATELSMVTISPRKGLDLMQRWVRPRPWASGAPCGTSRIHAARSFPPQGAPRSKGVPLTRQLSPLVMGTTHHRPLQL